MLEVPDQTFHFRMYSGMRIYFSTFMFLCLYTVGLNGSSAGKEDPASIEAIRGMWRKRQERLTSFDFSFRGTCSHGVEDRELFLARKAANADIQIEPISYNKTMRFVVSGPKAYIEYNSRKWGAESKAYSPTKTIIASNGELVRTSFFPGVRTFPTFHIEKARDGNAAGSAFFVLPLNLAFRPLKYFAVNQLMFGGRQDFEGRSLVLLNHREDVIWVDPSRDFIPIRYYQRRGNETTRFIEISYELDNEYGWIPKSWKDNASRMSYSAELNVEKRAINTEVAERMFDINPEPNALVSDYVTDTFYIDRGSDKRIIRPGEWKGSNYEELLHGDEGKNTRLFLIALFSLGGFALFYVWRRERRSKAGK